MNPKRALLVAMAVLLLTVPACDGGGMESQSTQEAVQGTDSPVQAAPTATEKPMATPTQKPLPTVGATEKPLPTAAPRVVESEWAIAAIASSEYDSPGWSAQQATGEPNTAECGDFETAWAARGASETAWLEVSFATPLVPTEIQIYESYSPGSIVRVEVIDQAGAAHDVWQGTPQAVETCPRVFRVPVTGVSSPVARVRITLDQSIIQDWGEIDAVQLTGTRQPGAAVVPTAVPTAAPPARGIIAQWASQATASSEYDNPGWSAQQATGEPNTLECGDFETAWAARGASETAWLEVSFATPLVPTEILIYESYSPGSIVRVEVIDQAGAAHGVWQGTPQAVETCPRVFRVPVTGVSSPVARVRITLDQSIIQDWGEIDAVQLLGVPAP